MAVSKIDKGTARTIGQRSIDALKPLAEELGLEIKLGRGKFDPTVGEFTMKVEFSLPGSAEREFALQAPAFGLAGDHYGELFEWNGTKFALRGFRMRAPKRPIVAENLEDGKQYVLPEKAIKPLQPEGYRDYLG